MTYHKKGASMNITRFLILLLVACMVVACGEAAPATDAPVATEQTTGNDVATADEPVVEEATGTEESPSEDTAATETDVWTPDSYSDSLHLLESYSLTFSYSVTSNGKKTDWSWKQSVQAEPDITITTWQGTDSPDMTMVGTAESLYMISGDPATCMVLANPEENPTIFDPDSIMETFGYDLVAAGAGPDIDGRPTDKYVYDSTLPDGSKYHSEVLVDREEQYTLKWDVTGETKNNDALEPFSWSYVLSDINAVPTITVPDACASITSASWPMPTDATVTMQTEQMFSLTTKQSVSDVSKFYADAMIAEGYAVSDGGMETPDMVNQVYAKDGKTVNVMITASDGTTTVIIAQNE
jgi:hypothetical protein